VVPEVKLIKKGENVFDGKFFDGSRANSEHGLKYIYVDYYNPGSNIMG
jgi:hypothetical protein